MTDECRAHKLETKKVCLKYEVEGQAKPTHQECAQQLSDFISGERNIPPDSKNRKIPQNLRDFFFFPIDKSKIVCYTM